MVKKAIKITAFILIMLALFLLIQEITVPDWNNTGGVEKMISGFLKLEKESVDVVFIGTSHVGRGISPMEIYEDTGICSYNLGTSGQPIEGSYVLLKEAFRTQTPSLVVLDGSMMFDKVSTKKNNYFRYIMDALYLTPSFWEAAKIYESIPGNDGLMSAYLPIMKFHTRWNEWKLEDFDTIAHQDYYTMGYYMTAGIEAGPSLEYIEEKAKDSTVEMSEAFCTYFEKIKTLCQENGAELLLIKVPCYYEDDTFSWHTGKANAAAAFAEENGITMLDMQFTGLLDPAVHSCDGGAHLNVDGALKVSEYLGTYISENYPDLCNRTEKKFEALLAEYQKARDVALLQTCDDFSEFVQMLDAHKKDWSVFITSYKDYTAGLTEADYELLAKLGLEKISQGEDRDAYAAVICGGEVAYEELSKDAFTHKMKVNGNRVELGAAGYAVDIDAVKTHINGTSYGNKKRGLNIVVWDHETNLPLCSVWFDTHVEEKTYGFKASTPEEYFRDYEEAVCFAD